MPQFEIGRFFRPTSQAIATAGIRKCFSSFASGIRCYFRFCELRRNPPYPVRGRVIVERGSIFKEGTDFPNYVGYVRKACRFLELPLSRGTPAVANVVAGSKLTAHGGIPFSKFHHERYCGPRHTCGNKRWRLSTSTIHRFPLCLARTIRRFTNSTRCLEWRSPRHPRYDGQIFGRNHGGPPEYKAGTTLLIAKKPTGMRPVETMFLFSGGNGAGNYAQSMQYGPVLHPGLSQARSFPHAIRRKIPTRGSKLFLGNWRFRPIKATLHMSLGEELRNSLKKMISTVCSSGGRLLAPPSFLGVRRHYARC